MAEPKEGDRIAVWFSSGAASAIAARETIRRYGDRCEIALVNNIVIEEDPDNLRFLFDVMNWLNRPIDFAVNPQYPACSAVEVWERRAFMSGPAGAPCTLELKKKARAAYEMDHDIDWHVLGFTSEERHRFDHFAEKERPNTLPVLINADIDKRQCFEQLTVEGLALPDIYRRGYPNANCIGCVKATSPTYWNLVRKDRPDIFDQRAEQSGRIGARLVRYRGERIYLGDLPPDAKGRPLKTDAIECGIFCTTNEED